MIKIDASSGGQVFRNAISLSALLKKDVKVTSIRHDKDKPGLKLQHLAGLKFLAASTSAKVFGAKLHSQKVVFRPSEFSGGNFSLTVGSAGSVCLVIQSMLLPAILKETKVRVVGGTDVPFAPPSNFLSQCLFPILKKSGLHFDLSVLSRGYYPAGNGRVLFSSKPVKQIKAFNLAQRKNFESVNIFCHSAGLPTEVTKRMAKTAKDKIASLGFEPQVFFDVHETKETVGCGIEIFGVSKNSVISASALGKKGVAAEKIALHAVENFFLEADSNACVDVHTADQLVSFMALAKGKSVFSTRILSHHLLKSIEVTENFTGAKFKIQEKNNYFFVSVEGTDFFSQRFSK